MRTTIDVPCLTLMSFIFVQRMTTYVNYSVSVTLKISQIQSRQACQGTRLLPCLYQVEQKAQVYFSVSPGVSRNKYLLKFTEKAEQKEE